ncbi:alpha/beta hydrolase [Candidatus Bipolaricaulota bacterium]|nr:alpha/beta hydrolase [Candidatus Bipolaricaulota bacterium]
MTGQVGSNSIAVWGRGQGPPVVLVHGSLIDSPHATWKNVRALADRYELRSVVREGYEGRARQLGRRSAAIDISLVAGALRPSAHLVGFSSGGSIALAVASSYPESVRSLTVIEPLAFSCARGGPAVEAFIQRLAPLFDRAHRLSPESFWEEFVRISGLAIPIPPSLRPEHRRAVSAMMSEPPPWKIPVSERVLHAALFPKMIAVGGDRPFSWIDAAIREASPKLARSIGARFEVFREAGHAVHLIGSRFNHRLESIWQEGESYIARRTGDCWWGSAAGMA